MNLKILNQLFKRVFVLTLPRYPNRRRRLEEQLAGVDVTWCKGVDAKDYTREQLVDLIHRRSPNLKVPDAFQEKDLAIWVGQQGILDMVVEADGLCLVMEDDAFFVPGADEMLDHYSKQWSGDPVNGEIDLLFLSRPNPASYPDIFWQNKSDHHPVHASAHMPGTTQTGRRRLVRADGMILDHVYGAGDEWVSACCYAITPAAVSELRKPRTPRIWPYIVTYDFLLGLLCQYENDFKFRCFGVTPNVAIPMFVEGEL